MTIEEIKRTHTGNWFAPETMRFWRSRVSSKTFGRYFVTSDDPRGSHRAYTVRYIDRAGNIESVSEFQEFSTLREALKVAKRYHKESQEG